MRTSFGFYDGNFLRFVSEIRFRNEKGKPRFLAFGGNKGISHGLIYNAMRFQAPIPSYLNNKFIRTFYKFIDGTKSFNLKLISYIAGKIDGIKTE